ncbi:hypothetical protein [Thermophilibacter provencensis]|uniref:Uncharacterized protein n=1 Tax=Thermophilibacter provencensis TaxID=1852386 RepID=A0ABT7V4K2_9ACTN|nr:hypothetical protein [Thermophilibacter provencensis]MDM8271529.1 hypothetical protein [Thermophilibacter provencensis]
MSDELILMGEPSYLRRLGTLCSVLCGVSVLLGVVLIMLDPGVESLVATLVALVMTVLGLALSRR